MSEYLDEIFSDMEKTLKQLIQNAEAIKIARTNNCLVHELEALQKTQESLLARLIHRQSMIDIEQKQKALQAIRKETIEKEAAEYGKKGAILRFALKRSARKKYLKKKVQKEAN